MASAATATDRWIQKPEPWEGIEHVRATSKGDTHPMLKCGVRWLILVPETARKRPLHQSHSDQGKANYILLLLG